MATNDYTSDALIKRVKLKAFVSSSGNLSDQEILDLANDSLRSYLVPTTKVLREEWWVGKKDLILTTGTDGSVTVPDSVASTLRTVAWLNGGQQCPLTRVEPENSFAYLQQTGNTPVGYELRGFTLFVLPKAPGIQVYLTAMLRPPQIVLVANAGKVASFAGAVLTLSSVPLSWQTSAPTQVDVVSGASPFSTVGTFGVSSLVGLVLTLTSDPGLVAGAESWVADVAASPFANVPIELYPLLEQDIIVQLYSGLGDKRGPGAEKRRDALELKAKQTMAARTQGSARPIVNPNAPGMRMGGWPRR